MLSKLGNHSLTFLKTALCGKGNPYALDYNNMKLISFDAKYYKDHPEHRPAQVKWLDSVLASNDKKWITLFMHYPIYSTARQR